MTPIRPIFARLLAPLLLAGACCIAAATGASAAEPAQRVQLAQSNQPVESKEPGQPKQPGQARQSKQQPNAAGPARQARQPVAIPQGCAGMRGVQRRICVECDSVALHKRIGCQQRVFWTTCKGKRLFEDSYCQAHQDQGPPKGEGG